MVRIRRLAVPCAVVLLAGGTYVAAGSGGTAAGASAVERPQAAPHWSPVLGPIPRAIAHTSPALTSIAFPEQSATALIVWTGSAVPDAGYQLSFETAINLGRNDWSAPQTVDQGAAVSERSPSAASYPGAANQVVVAWTDHSGQVRYSVGTARLHRSISWTPADSIPDASASSGPYIFSLLHSDAILATWKAANTEAIDYAVATPGGGTSLAWSAVSTLPAAQTFDTPTVAEASTGSSSGTLYVLWASPSGQIYRSTTPDPLSVQPEWTTPAAFPSAIRTDADPVGLAIGRHASYPILIVYHSTSGRAFEYLTMKDSGAVSQPSLLALRGAEGPAVSIEGEAVVVAALVLDPLEYQQRPCYLCEGP